MGSRLAQAIEKEYNKKSFLFFPIYHSDTIEEKPMHAYNEVLGFNPLINIGVKIPFDNGRIAEMTSYTK
jgi:hypothetical protein